MQGQVFEPEGFWKIHPSSKTYDFGLFWILTNSLWLGKI